VREDVHCDLARFFSPLSVFSLGWAWMTAWIRVNLWATMSLGKKGDNSLNITMLFDIYNVNLINKSTFSLLK